MTRLCKWVQFDVDPNNTVSSTFKYDSFNPGRLDWNKGDFYGLCCFSGVFDIYIKATIASKVNSKILLELLLVLIIWKQSNFTVLVSLSSNTLLITVLFHQK